MVHEKRSKDLELDKTLDVCDVCRARTVQLLLSCLAQSSWGSLKLLNVPYCYCIVPVWLFLT